MEEEIVTPLMGSGSSAPSTTTTEGQSSFSPSADHLSIRAPVLVEFTMENVTYAPLTRTATTTTTTDDKPPTREGGGGIKNILTSNGNEKTRKVILQSVSTTIAPYQLSAWMGPSGSGKTSLLSIAAGLISNPEEDLRDGSVLRVNGTAGMVPKRLVGVVWQDDLLLPNLTVEETIQFAARLKTPESFGTDQIQTLVNETMNELGLFHIRTSLIGDARVRGISGGERKRVSVASELVARPSVLLLDEPTSGLDATSAQSLIDVLKGLTLMGHAVAVVVHQPRTTMFEHFDNLLLLSRGRTVFNGKACEARKVLEMCDSVGKLPEQTGIADWILDVITEDEHRDDGGGVLADHWLEVCENQTKSSGGDDDDDGVGDDEGGTSTSSLQEQARKYNRRILTLEELNATPKFKTSFWTQLRLLTSRAHKQERGEGLTHVAILTTVAYTVLTGLFWFRLPDDTNRIYERVSLLFFFIISQSNGIVVSALTVFQRERALLKRERAKKMYGVLPYFLAKTTSDLTNTVFLPCLYGAIVYWVANLRSTASAYFTFLLTFYVTVSTAQATGFLISIAIPNIQISLMLAPLFTIFLMMLGGFYIPLNNLHPGIEWASYASFARYAYTALVVNEFDGRDVPCAEGDVSITIGDGTNCPLPGEDVLESLGIEGKLTNLWLNVGLQLVIQIVSRVVAYVLLRRSR